jgi:hypothetical protein
MAATAHRIFPHGAPKALADGVWQVKGSLPMPLPRNMTILRLADGGLLLYSAIAMDDAGLAALEALGRPAVMVVPHTDHLMDAPFYAARYPGLRVVAAEDARALLGTRVTVHATPEAALPALGVRSHRVAGLKRDEIVLEVDLAGGGKALVFTDLIGNVPRAPGVRGAILGLLGTPGGGPGVARIVRFRQIADRAAVRAWLEKMAALPDVRMLLVAHGQPILDGAPELLAAAARSL